MKKLMMTAVTMGLVALVWASLGAAQNPPSQEPSATDKVRIVGWALNMSNIATGANQTIQIDIDGWSNPSQRQHLIEVRGAPADSPSVLCGAHRPRPGACSGDRQLESPELALRVEAQFEELVSKEHCFVCPAPELAESVSRNG